MANSLVEIENSLKRGLVEFYVSLGCLAVVIVAGGMNVFGFGGESLSWAAIGASIMTTVLMCKSLAVKEKSRKVKEP